MNKKIEKIIDGALTTIGIVIGLGILVLCGEIIKVVIESIIKVF
jgi:hypothetical protein